MATNDSVPLFEYDNDETLISWLDEANAIMNDVRMHVDEIKVSTELPSSDCCIYINIRTKEQNCYCIYVSSSGFRIVGHAYDTIEKKQRATKEEQKPKGEGEAEAEAEEEDEVFETPYALLDKISPSYVQSFGDQLCKQLLQLQQMQMQFNEEDEEEEAEQEEEQEQEEEEESNVLNKKLNI